MKKVKKIVTILTSTLFSFLLCFLFNTCITRAYDGRNNIYDYSIYELTIPSVKLYEYTADTENGNINVNESSVFEVDFKYFYVGKSVQGYDYKNYFTGGEFYFKGFHSLESGKYHFQQDINIEDSFINFYNNLNFLLSNSNRTVDQVFDKYNSDVINLTDYIYVFYYDDTHGYNVGVLDYLIYPEDLYNSMKLVHDNPESYVINKSLDYKATDNQDVIDQYIEDNNYHSNDEYLEYGEIKYQEGKDVGFIEGVDSIDITIDNQEYTDNYIKENNYHTDEEYLEYGKSKKQEGYSEGVNSVDTDMYQQIGYEQGYEVGVKSVDITSDNEEAINKYITENNMKTETKYNQYGETKYSEGYTKGQEDGYSTGYKEGVNSLDIDNVKAQEYEKGYNAGYEEGVSSVDITIDNTIAINNYITENNMKTEAEYLAYGEQQYQAGISSVDRDAIITNYITEHKLYNETEYLNYGNNRYSEGVNSVDITADNEYVIQQYISANDMKTKSEYDSYGEFMYQEGVNSVDITSDNQKVIDDFIKSNNYYSLEEYVDYGIAEYYRGYSNGANSVDTESYRLLGYEQGYKDGENSVDITIDNQEAINKYIDEHNYHSDGEYVSYGNNRYNQGFGDGVKSVYGNIEDDEVVKEYVTNYIKVNKYYTSTQYIDNYDKGYNDGYTIGYEDGLSLSGIDEIKASEYQRGYNDGYAIGYSEGEYSVDITQDNDQAIDIYITENHYHPHWEFELNFDLGWEAGIYYVYNNLDVDLTIQEYVKNYIEKNNYYTEKEFTDNYKLGYENGYAQGYDDGYDLGESNVDKVITNELLVETMKEKLGKGLTINLLTKGNMNLLIKNYDLDIDDTGDTKITIHYGQDKYEVKTETIVEVVPGENNTQSENTSKIETILAFILMVGCGIGVIVLIVCIFNFLTKFSKKNKKKKNYLRRKKS